MIRIQGLHKYYNKGKQNQIHVINDVTLDLPEKGMVAIFGKSGCGKTTLLNVIGGLDSFAEGSLTIEGQDVEKDTDRIRNQYVGYIFQNYNLNQNESCFDNVADALRLCGVRDKEVIESRARAALSFVGMEKYRKRAPDTLSGGQMQRVAIARAIVKNPKIILADEPTGNLDEANTVMIMDLLKEISRDHLVLLVTHEEALVDYYCDTVIEISDGKIVSTRNNTAAEGYASRDKNDIYLGELPHTQLSNDSALISYYGAPSKEKIRLKIVHVNGKTYVQVDSPGVQLLDESSEIRVKEGVFQEQKEKETENKAFDLSLLPALEGTNFGRLFSFFSSLRSSYRENFKKRKKGKNLLRRCMALFAGVVVLMSAFFGTAFQELIQIRDSYSHRTFYVYTPNAQVSQILNDAESQKEAGIDLVRLIGTYPNGDDQITFRTGNFETFSQRSYDSLFQANGVYLNLSLAKDLPLAEGKQENLSADEILISTKMADALLEKSSLGYVKNRHDLIGLVAADLAPNGKNLRIAGIVESSESAVYLTEIALAKIARNYGTASHSELASDYGFSLATGKAILVLGDNSVAVPTPSLGEAIKIQGRSVKISSILRPSYSYEEYLAQINEKKPEATQYFLQLAKKENPQWSEESPELQRAAEKLRDERYFEYLDDYYSELDSFYENLFFFDRQNFALWLYLEMDVEAARFAFVSEEYFKANAFRKQYGRYPSLMELYERYDQLPAWDIQDYAAYKEEFYKSHHSSGMFYNTVLLSDEDFIATGKQLGETHPIANPYRDYEKEISSSTVAAREKGKAVVDTDVFSPLFYTVIHSFDPEETTAFLSREFSQLEGRTEYRPAILTPTQVFREQIEDRLDSIVRNLITMLVILIMMSLCMYFIMRSSLMNRIKEVGIYRAIGVSKRNLIFRFLVEAALLTTLSVFLGYLFASGFLYAILQASSLVKEIFYYPLWMAGIVLILLYGISLFFGVLPILSLLKKTPSEILAKYDI